MAFENGISHNVFHLFQKKIFLTSENALNIHNSKILSLGKEQQLTLYQTTLSLDWSKLEKFAENKINIGRKSK